MIPGRLARGLGLFCASVHKKIPRCGEGSRHFAFRQLPSIILIVAVLAALPSGFLVPAVRVVLILLSGPLTPAALSSATLTLLNKSALPAAA